MKKFFTFFTENLKFILIGLAAGAVNGFFGGGAGLLLVPLLKHAGGLDVKNAHATSVAITFVLSLATFIVYIAKGAFSGLPSLYSFIIGSTIGGLLGGFALKKIPKKVLKTVFSLFLIYSGVRMIIG